MGNSLFRPDHYREMAEEIRSIADNMGDSGRAESMRKIAADYERMCESAQRAEDGLRAMKPVPAPHGQLQSPSIERASPIEPGRCSHPKCHTLAG